MLELKKQSLGIRTFKSVEKEFGVGSVSCLSKRGFIKYLPKVKGEMRKVSILNTFPNKEEISKWIVEDFSVPLEEVISSSCGEFECLKDELQEWFDNLPEQFQSGDKGC